MGDAGLDDESLGLWPWPSPKLGKGWRELVA